MAVWNFDRITDTKNIKRDNEQCNPGMGDTNTAEQNIQRRTNRQEMVSHRQKCEYSMLAIIC